MSYKTYILFLCVTDINLLKVSFNKKLKKVKFSFNFFQKFD